MKRHLIILISFIATSCFSQSIPKVDALVNETLTTQNIPALAIGVIKEGKIVHLQTAGYKDFDAKEKGDIHTSFHIASISKTITNMAIFQLVENGKIDLDADINQYLPFKVKNPHIENDKITVKQLLNHRSGILDNYDLYGPYWGTPKGDPEENLDDFLEDYLSTEGTTFQKSHYAKKEERRNFRYSNTGFALLGLIVDEVTGMTYEGYCRENIFKPLELEETSWFLRNLDENQVAKTYEKDDDGKLNYKGHNGYPDYPAGQLRTSISDFSKIILAYLNAKENSFILKKETLERITPTPSLSHEGYFTWYITPINGRMYYNHDGGDLGVRTTAIMDVKEKNAIIIFANTGTDLTNLRNEIARIVFE